eukprot:6189019-Pleurochrysis_carterae.AAC.5
MLTSTLDRHRVVRLRESRTRQSLRKYPLIRMSSLAEACRQHLRDPSASRYLITTGRISQVSAHSCGRQV